MKKYLALLLALLLAFSAAPGCAVVSFNDGSINIGPGSEFKDHTYPCGDFTEFHSSLSANVIYRAEESDTLLINMPEEVAQHVTVTNNEGVLTVSSNKGIVVNNDTKLPTIYVSALSLSAISFSGIARLGDFDAITADSFSIESSGTISGELNIQAGALAFDISGAGGLILSGSAGSADIASSGACDIKASNLIVKNANIDISGVGTVEIGCTGTLNANITGAGEIKYWGDPAVNKSGAGLGGVKKAG